MRQLFPNVVDGKRLVDEMKGIKKKEVSVARTSPVARYIDKSDVVTRQLSYILDLLTFPVLCLFVCSCSLRLFLLAGARS